jgi:hypothetical protein
MIAWLGRHVDNPDHLINDFAATIAIKGNTG